MYTLIDKLKHKGYLSQSKKEIAKASGFKKDRLNYYSRSQFKSWYENDKVIFFKAEVLKSRQGGKRQGFKEKIIDYR